MPSHGAISSLAFTSGAVGTASALGYVFARPLQAKETVPCTPQNCVHVQQLHHRHHTQACHVHKRFRLFRQKNKCPVHGPSRPNYILPPSTVHPLVVHPDKILPDQPTPPPRSSSLTTFRLSAPVSPPPYPSSPCRSQTPIPPIASVPTLSPAPTPAGAVPLPGRLLTKHSNRTEHSFLGLSSSFSSSRLSSFSTCSSTSSHSTSATTTTPATTPSSSFAQGSDIESFMNEHGSSHGKKQSLKSHGPSHVHHPAPIHTHSPAPLLLQCSCDRQHHRSPSPAVDTRPGGAASPRSPPLVSNAQSRLRRIWRDSFQWPRQASTTPNKPKDTFHNGCAAAEPISPLSPPSRRATPYATASLPTTSTTTTSKIVIASSPSGRAPASSSSLAQQHPLRRPYPAHTYDRNASPYVSDEGNHSISEHEEEDDDDDDSGRFSLERASHGRSSFQGDGPDNATAEHVLRSFPEGERLESELDRCSPEPPSPHPSSRKVLVEDEDEDDEDWDIQSDAGAPSSSPMYAAGAAQPASFSTVTLPLSGAHNQYHHHHHHHHHCHHHSKGPSNSSARSRQRCISLPADHSQGHQHRQHGGSSVQSGSLGNRGMFKLPSLPSENWDEDFEIEADINVPTQVVETQISLQMDIYNIKDFALQIEDLKTLRASLRTASRSLRAKNPNKHQHLSTLFQRDWEQAEVIIDLGEIAQTQSSPPSPTVAAPKTNKGPSRRPSKKRLAHHSSPPAPFHSRTTPSSTAPTAPQSPRESAWRRLSRMATGSSSKSGSKSPAMSVDSPMMQGGQQGYFSPVESSAASPLASPSEMDSIIYGLSIGTPMDESPSDRVVGHNYQHDKVDQGAKDSDDDQDEDEDDMIDDGYESFSCYSYSFMDGPITGVVSPIPTDRHMQVLKDILVEGLGHEVAQQFVFKHGEQDHVKFSVEVIPGLLNHLKGLQRRLSEQLLEFQRYDEQQQQKQQLHEQMSQEIDRNQRPGRASMGGAGDSMRHLHHHRRRSMRPPLDLDFHSERSTHTLKEVENEAEATVEPVAV